MKLHRFLEYQEDMLASDKTGAGEEAGRNGNERIVYKI